jgi:hypothetical protein
MQRELLTELVANRFDLGSSEFRRALNAAAVAFSESQGVRQAIVAFHGSVVSANRTEDGIQQKLLAMLRSMFEYLNLPHGDLTDEFLLRPFSTTPPTPPVAPSALPMPTSAMKALADPGKRPVFQPTGAPAFSGGGSSSHTCPKCSAVLLSNVPAAFTLAAVIKCPKCGTLCDLG